MRNPSPARANDGRLAVVAAGVALGYGLALVALFLSHGWILDAQNRPEIADFVSFWSAGKLALKGAAASAYDPARQHAAEVAAAGHAFGGALEWNYPPLFFFVAAALASMPYAAAFAAWCSLTLGLFATTMAKIARRADAAVFACAAPPVLAALIPGQNGFLTASLVGSALLLMEKRPAAAGIVLGLLSYKPQFGILFPLALAVGGYWRTFFWAGATALTANGVAVAIFGAGTFGGFAHALAVTGDMRLAHAGMGWSKLQSLYGLMRTLGFAAPLAWAAQGLLSVAAALVVMVTWRARVPHALKAALIASAIPLATPYVLAYDLPVLCAAAAFVYRDRSFDRLELALLVATVPAFLVPVLLPIPAAFFASVAIAAIVGRRLYGVFPRSRINPSWLTEATSLPSSE